MEIERREGKSPRESPRFLNPEKKLVDEVVAYLTRRTKADGRDNFFDHLMVVVPTAESGRNLRLALAKAFLGYGVVPPHVVQPVHLLKPADTNIRQASDVELQAAFLSFIVSKKLEIKERNLWNLLFKPNFLDDARALLGFLDQLNEIWHALAGKGLLMANVLKDEKAVKVLTRAVGCELERWEELGDFETEFFAFLETKGLCHYAKTVRLAVANPAPPPDGVTEVILPALVDPIQALYLVFEKWQATRPSVKITVLIHADERDAAKFDAWGRPKPNEWTHEILEDLRTADIFCSATNQALGEKVAGEFDKLKTKALPALGLIDAGTFSDVQSALMNTGKTVHNPERHALIVSSLGAIVDLLMSAWGKRGENLAFEWKEITGLLRQYDVMNFVAPAEGALDRAKILEEMDNFANKFLPVSRPTPLQLAYEDAHLSFRNLTAAIEKLETLWGGAISLSDFVSTALRKIFANPTANREFHAAAAAVRDLILELRGDGFQALPPKEQLLIARQALTKANYQLEPENKNVIKTLGWLELAWTPKEQIALAGFHEGCVPDALIGHAFLPDSLRVALGLTSNEQRFARDVYLLKEILACRSKNDVKFFVALANAAGDIQKPSRLLFLCADKDLPVRVRHLFDLHSSEPPPALPPQPWTYKWPTEVPLQNAREGFRGSLSPTVIDAYLNCPFTYFLKYGLGMDSVKMHEEIPANDFGTLAHAILENYARGHLKKPIGESEEQIREELGILCDTEFDRVYGSGKSLTPNMLLQLNSLKKRIQAFAKQQSAWAQAGWQIHEAEYKLNRDGDKRRELFPFAQYPDVALRGCVDRIDYHPSYGYRLIDYKTWDETKNAHVLSSRKEDLEFATGVMGLPLYEEVSVNKKGEEKRTKRAVKSIQLPLYARALEVKEPMRFKPGGVSRIYDLCYAVLGNSPENVRAVMSRDDEEEKVKLIDLRPLADEIVERLLDGILGNKFWPPSPDALTWDFGEYFFANIEKNVDREWIKKVTR